MGVYREILHLVHDSHSRENRHGSLGDLRSPADIDRVGEPPPSLFVSELA